MNIRTLLLAITLTASTSCFTLSCTKEPIPPAVEQEDDIYPGKLSAKVNGVQFNATLPILTILEGGGNPNYNTWGISGDRFELGMPFSSVNVRIIFHDFRQIETGNQFGGSVPGYLETILSIEHTQGFPYNYDFQATSTPEDSRLVITNLDRTLQRISGTFSGTAIDTVKRLEFIITEGIFTDLPYD